MGLKAEDVYGALSEQIESVDRKLDDAIVGIYSPGGSVAFDNLPALSADVLGKVYIVTDDFTTTSDFVEGEGIDYPGGTNVAIVNRGTNASPVYKYDATTGAIVVDDSFSNVSENPVQNKIITAKTQAIELAISQLSASVLSKASQTEVDEIKLEISNLSSSLLTKASQSEVNEIKLDISNLSASKASQTEVNEIKLSISDLSASKMDADKIVFCSQTASAPQNGDRVYDFVMPGYDAITALQACRWSGNGYASIVLSYGELVWSISGNPTNVVYGKVCMKR